jgi:hypothetical protein
MSRFTFRSLLADRVSGRQARRSSAGKCQARAKSTQMAAWHLRAGEGGWDYQHGIGPTAVGGRPGGDDDGFGQGWSQALAQPQQVADVGV